MDREQLVQAIVDAAALWLDADASHRSELHTAVLADANVFTESNLAFALNRFFHSLKADVLKGLAEHTSRCAPQSIVIERTHVGVDLLGLEAQVLAIVAGHTCEVIGDAEEWTIAHAFWTEVERRIGTALPISFEVAVPDTRAVSWRIPHNPEQPSEAWPLGYAVAVLDGRESKAGLEGLAEDLLVHDGAGFRSPKLVFAPESLSPDDVLDACAQFRAVIPGHPDVPSRLKMTQAFLHATGTPHAWSEDLTFLISRGDPEPQANGHVRWCTWTDFAYVETWLRHHANATSLVVARPSLLAKLDVPQVKRKLGEAHKPVFGTSAFSRLCLALLNGAA